MGLTPAAIGQTRMAKATKEFISRLCRVIPKDRLTLHYPRVNREQTVRLVAGPNWSEETSIDKKQPVNLLNLWLTIMGRNLIAKSPRVMLSTFQRENKAAVDAMEQWMNDEIETIHLAETLKRVVIDALYSVGICKISISTPSDAAMAGWNFQAGKPICERVDLDDFGFDVHARDFREADRIYHRYRVPLQTIQESKLYSKERKELKPSYDRLHNEQGDQKIGVLGRGTYSQMDELYDMVDLWEVWLPRERIVLTLASDDGGNPIPCADGNPLREQNWIGRDAGPYEFLGYETVPGNAMPKGPIQNLVDLHEAINRDYRKLVRQADRQKEILAVAGTSVEDGARILETSDGEATRVDSVDRLKVMMFGGPNAMNIQFGQHLRDLFDFMGGGLAILGGLAPQAGTLGQEELLNKNASASVSSMQDDTALFVGRVCEAMGWYWWNDPITTARTQLKVPGMDDMMIPRKVTPKDRQRTPWSQLRMKVDPYSYRPQSPQGRVAAILEIIKGVYLPMAQLAMQQGVALDLNALFDKLGKYLDQPDLVEIITHMEMPNPEESGTSGGIGGGASGGSGGAMMPPETTRNYVRRSMGDTSQASKNAELMGMLQAAGGGGSNGQARERYQ